MLQCTIRLVIIMFREFIKPLEATGGRLQKTKPDDWFHKQNPERRTRTKKRGVAWYSARRVMLVRILQCLRRNCRTYIVVGGLESVAIIERYRLFTIVCPFQYLSPFLYICLCVCVCVFVIVCVYIQTHTID